MPLLTVEFVLGAEREIAPGLAQALADAAGRALGSPPGQTWVRVRPLERNRYAENDSAVDDGDLPVFVTVVERHCPTGAALQAEVTALAAAIAEALRRPATCVHIEYAPSAAGRIAFGGKLIQ